MLPPRHGHYAAVLPANEYSGSVHQTTAVGDRVLIVGVQVVYVLEADNTLSMVRAYSRE